MYHRICMNVCYSEISHINESLLMNHTVNVPASDLTLNTPLGQSKAIDCFVLARSLWDSNPQPG